MTTNKITLYLDGAWQFAGVDHDPNPHLIDTSNINIKWLDAEVPGTVQKDLLKLGKISDPRISTNAEGLSWIEEKDWWYKRKFTVPEGMPGKRVELYFEGLDTYATVWLNGVLVGKHANMFVPCRFDVTDCIRHGAENELVIRFESTAILKDKDTSLIWDGMNAEREVPYARKAQFGFGWDWAPRVVTFGIWRPAKLVFYEELAIRDVWVRTRLVGTGAEIDIGCEIEDFDFDEDAGRTDGNENVGDTATDTVQRVGVNPGPDALINFEICYDGEKIACDQVRVTLSPGINFISKRLVLANPRLWWPNGMGEQALYSLKVSVVYDYHNGGNNEDNGADLDEALDEATVRFGVREVSLIQEEIGTETEIGARIGAGTRIGTETGTGTGAGIGITAGTGKTFTIAVNGEKVFAKGANWVPGDSLTVRLSPEKYRAFLGAARDANMNMLRIWGGGIYEDPVFYELCDELGIMIWQDFMYACQAYPDFDPDFAEEARREAEIIVKELRNHPCIVLWCGNNENQWIHTQRVHKGLSRGELPGQKIYDEILPEVCRRLDPTRPYWPGSPCGGPNPNSEMEGDRHSYEVALGVDDWGGHDFSWDKLRFEHYDEDAGKFISEFAAFAGIPEPEALGRFLQAGEIRADSEAWRYHVPHIHGWPRHFQDVLDFYTENLFGVPGTAGFEDWVKYARLVQGEGRKYGIEHFRRNKFQCSGTLFWSFNGSWPACDWGIIDYYGNPMPGYYFVKRAYEPVLVSLRRERDGAISVWVINDLLKGLRLQLRLWLVEFSGRVLWEERVDIDAGANSSAMVRRVSFEELERYRGGRGGGDIAFVAELGKAGEAGQGEGGVLSRNRIFLAPFRELELTEANLRLELLERDLERHDGAVKLRVATDVFAWAVRLHHYGTQFSDNYFDLLPGEERVIEARPIEYIRRNAGRAWVEELKKGIEVSALNAKPVRIIN
ncbi:MAG: hypothetical protein HPY71_09640 [Firmicutes bacterium]|nr:hypothetical protein [Bacillota bacterium]